MSLLDRRVGSNGTLGALADAVALFFLFLVVVSASSDDSVEADRFTVG